MEFLKEANLPEKKVGCVCISGHTNPEIKNNIEKLGIKTIFAPSAEEMKSPVRSHADIVLHHLGENNFVCEPTVYKHFSNIFGNKANLICGKKVLADKYPDDCYYNIARISDVIFLNVADSSILDFDESNYTRKINVKQGYCKCNICVVNKNAIITSDGGIYKAAVENGFDVLKIQSGYIELGTYDYGFIGGASGLISNDILAFCGDLKTHPDHESISSFLRNYNMYYENLSKGNLLDIGSIIPVFY